MASIYQSNLSEGSGPSSHDLLFIGSAFGSQNGPYHRYSNGTTLSGITAVSGDSSHSMTVTSGHDQNIRARSLPGDLRTRIASPRPRSNLRLQTDLEQEEHDTSRGSMEMGLTDEEESVQQGIDGERTPTQDNLLTNGSGNPSHDAVDGERSSDGETTSAFGHASMDDESYMNGERTPTDQRNHT